MSITVIAQSHRVLRYSAWDSLRILLSLVYAALLLSVPSIPLIAIGLWWTANTVAHNFIHTPFFRSRSLNRLYSIYLSALMGFPQGRWRARHLQHHRGDERPARWTRDVIVETGVVVSLWLVLAAVGPWSFATVYVPGYLAGLGLCFLQGHFEHVRGTTSHYGWLYNRLFFNDGYHVEHHHRPGVHWTRLPLQTDGQARCSRWPPVLRWMDAFSLEFLERIALQSPRLQRYVLAAHERAFRTLLAELPPVRRITIVGGGLFPRTALILRKLRPEASLTIIDAKRDHLEVARPFLEGLVELRHQFFDPRSGDDGDLVVIPLSFIGDRHVVYGNPPAPAVLIHDWLWKTRGGGVRVSWLLLKRLNLVTR
jgi:fatty acid desaturase